VGLSLHLVSVVVALQPVSVVRAEAHVFSSIAWEHVHVPRAILVVGAFVEQLNSGTTVAEVSAGGHGTQGNLVTEHRVLLNDPERGIRHSMVRVVVSVGCVLTSDQKLPVVVPELNSGSPVRVGVRVHVHGCCVAFRVGCRYLSHSGSAVQLFHESSNHQDCSWHMNVFPGYGTEDICFRSHHGHWLQCDKHGHQVEAQSHNQPHESARFTLRYV